MVVEVASEVQKAASRGLQSDGGRHSLLARGILRGFERDSADPTYRASEHLRCQNQKLRAARDLLLPRLMSGEIAV